MGDLLDRDGLEALLGEQAATYLDKLLATLTPAHAHTLGAGAAVGLRHLGPGLALVGHAPYPAVPRPTGVRRTR